MWHQLKTICCCLKGKYCTCKITVFNLFFPIRWIVLLGVCRKIYLSINIICKKTKKVNLQWFSSKEKITTLVNSLVWHNAKDALTRLAITAHPTSFKKAHDGSIFIPNLISAFNVKDKYFFCHSYSQSILLSPNCSLKLSMVKVCRNVWPILLDVWLIPHHVEH